MDWQRMKTAWADKLSAILILSRILPRRINSLLCSCCISDQIKQHPRPVTIKYYSLESHTFLVGLRHIIVVEERNHSNGIHHMVVTWRDCIPPRDGVKQQTCPVRSDKTDSDSQVGRFFVKKDQANSTLESGYYSAGLVTGSVVPPPSHQTHTLSGQVSVKEGRIALSSDAEADKGVDSKGESLLQESNDTDQCKPEDHFVDPPETDADIGSVTSRNDSDSNASVSIADEDGRTASNCEFIKDKHCSASSVEEYGSARAGDDETDGHHLVPNAQGRDEDSALGFPTPASLEEAPSHDIHCVTVGSTATVSVASGLPTALSTQYHFPSALKSSPGSPSTSLGPSSVHLQHGNSNELLQSISYTTNSFQKPTTTANAKKEPQHGAAATVVSKDIATPKQRDVLPTTLATRHRHLPDVQDKPGLHDGSGDGDLMTRAVSETSAGKMKDSACVIVTRVLLPASMKAELTLRSPTSRFKEDAAVGGLSSGRKLTPSSGQESRPAHRLTFPEGKQFQAGCIIFSNIAAFEAGSFLPLPSQEAVERSIGKGGNGTISIVYFKGAEFAVKRTHFRQMEVEILASLSHDNILPLHAVMMGEEDPQRPSRHLCYHFLPRMSGDLQSYLTKVGHGALSNLLMQHKEEPTMLQLVVDNTKHILRSTLKALAYLHRNNIVHNDVKPSNFLTNTQCSCGSPLICDHGQIFAVKLSDFDSALEVTKVQTRHSVLRQFYRNNPSGTPGYRPPEYVLVATRTRDELDAGTLTAADVWGFGCSVLKIFLSHSGPHTQKQMSFLHLWDKGGYPWEVEGERAREELKLALLERVYPNWPQLWEFVSDCLKVAPHDRMQCSKLMDHPFFAS